MAAVTERYFSVDQLCVKWGAAVALLMAVLVPSLVFLLLGASSMAQGILLVAAGYTYCYLALGGFAWRTPLSARSYLLLLALALSVLHSCVTLPLYDASDCRRSFLSYLFLLVYGAGACSFARLALEVPESAAHHGVKTVFRVLVVAAVAGALHISPLSQATMKPVLFYAEPSHFALSFLPVLLYMVTVAPPRRKVWLLLLGFLSAVSLQNLTLLVGVSFMAVLSLPRKKLLLLLPLAALGLSAVGIDYYMRRMNFASDSPNLSTLVYMQGWERAWLNLVETTGVGVGFQQFGIVGSRGKFMAMLGDLEFGNLNLFDGGSVASKLIGEFGGFALMGLACYLLYFRKNYRWLRRVSLHGLCGEDRRDVFFRCVFVMYCIDFFVRGTGYFSSSGFLFLAALTWMTLRRHPAAEGDAPSSAAASLCHAPARCP